jgi:hypothetical protein
MSQIQIVLSVGDRGDELRQWHVTRWPSVGRCGWRDVSPVIIGSGGGGQAGHRRRLGVATGLHYKKNRNFCQLGWGRRKIRDLEQNIVGARP